MDVGLVIEKYRGETGELCCSIKKGKFEAIGLFNIEAIDIQHCQKIFF